MDSPTYEMITSIGTLLFVILSIRKIFHPFHCKCGYLTWNASKMMNHIEIKHVRETSK